MENEHNEYQLLIYNAFRLVRDNTAMKVWFGLVKCLSNGYCIKWTCNSNNVQMVSSHVLLQQKTIKFKKQKTELVSSTNLTFHILNYYLLCEGAICKSFLICCHQLMDCNYWRKLWMDMNVCVKIMHFAAVCKKRKQC